MPRPCPIVSVIMPVFNVEKYVAEAVHSVLAQSFADFELIIVDDGSTDQSIAICESFEDPRILIKGQANRGLAGARNTGISFARGRFIALLDSDDAWHPEKLARHVAHLQQDASLGASTSGAALMDGESRSIGIAQRPKLGTVTAADVFCGRVVLNGSAPVFRREMLEEAASTGPDGRRWYFDETLRRSEDVECWTRLALTSRFRFEALPALLTRYRINAGGLSADVIRQLDSWDAVRDRLAAIDAEFIARFGATARGLELRYLARRCVQMRDRGLGLHMMLQALQHHPAMLWREPRKTLTTLSACAALRVLPAAGFRSLLAMIRPGLAQAVAP